MSGMGSVLPLSGDREREKTESAASEAFPSGAGTGRCIPLFLPSPLVFSLQTYTGDDRPLFRSILSDELEEFGVLLRVFTKGGREKKFGFVS